ncbi:HpcH/HpaI aldolase/citrate lyase family protein [Peristeroidobacter agariperforans]|uniref:HpcH/HpaI aldolase/citrate lyase family protein n=1 Tax=Peristeroidobacter agariperforans TaxID=268404 RepID=UPI00101DFF12|nr:CoA ester lyase [Peristeroidobacter agariperforans]
MTNVANDVASVLFVPGSKPERTSKALASAARIVCVDLEDSVPASDKATARAAALAALGAGDRRLALRINGIKTRAGLEDLLALVNANIAPPLLLVPMVESAAEIAVVTAAFGGKAPAIVPLIETVQGLRAAHEIAAAPGVAAMMFGGGDFAAELGVALAWEPLLAARGAFILACAGAGIGAIDVPFIGLDDQQGLIAETRAAKQLGFTGKAAIHPAQVDAINAVMLPTAEEIAEAQEAAQAFAAANGAAVRFKGRMLEAPIMRRYRRILDQGSLMNMRSEHDA